MARCNPTVGVQPFSSTCVCVKAVCWKQINWKFTQGINKVFASYTEFVSFLFNMVLPTKFGSSCDTHVLAAFKCAMTMLIIIIFTYCINLSCEIKTIRLVLVELHSSCFIEGSVDYSKLSVAFSTQYLTAVKAVSSVKN